MYKHISVNVDQSIFILTIYHIDVVLRIVFNRQLKNNEVIYTRADCRVRF